MRFCKNLPGAFQQLDCQPFRDRDHAYLVASKSGCKSTMAQNERLRHYHSSLTTRRGTCKLHRILIKAEL